MTRDPDPPWTGVPNGAELIDLASESDHDDFTNSNQEEVKIKVEPTPKSSTTAGLGNSILQPKQTAPPSEPWYPEAQDSVQRAIALKFYTNGGLSEYQEFQEPESATQRRLKNFSNSNGYDWRDRTSSENKKTNGTLTSAEKRRFMEPESLHKHRKRRRDFLAQSEVDPPAGSRKRRPKETPKSPAIPPTQDGPKRKKPRTFSSPADFQNWAKQQAPNTNTGIEGDVATTSGSTRREGIASLVKNAGYTQASKDDAHLMEKSFQKLTNQKGVSGNNRVILPEAGGWKLKGMTTALRNHQVENLGFMREREMGKHEPRGGILADHMGLGKTVTCIANLVNGRPLRSFPPDLQPESHTTLILVPSSIVCQWENEINKHTIREDPRDTWGLGGTMTLDCRTAKTFPPANYKLFDVILAPYSVIRASLPQIKYPPKSKPEEKERLRQQNWDKRGPLLKHKWLRVVVDEGHAIRNGKSQLASACKHLDADHKWILTGTPMYNGVSDLHQLFEYIGVPGVSDMTARQFKTKFGGEKDEHGLHLLGQEAQKYIRGFTTKDKIFDAPILDLPKAHKGTLKLQPTTLEKEMYKIVQARFLELLEQCEPQERGKIFLAMWTILRRMTAHPLLVTDNLSNYLELEDYRQIDQVIQEQSLLGEIASSTVRAYQDLLRQLSNQMSTGNTSDDTPEPQDTGKIDRVELDQTQDIQRKVSRDNRIGGMHGENVKSAAYGASINVNSTKFVATRQKKCVKCKKPAKDPVISNCYHIYCRNHLKELCGEEADHNSVCVSPGCENLLIWSDLTDPEGPPWLVNNIVLPSTKTLAVKAQILNWLDPKHGGDPDAKCIIFTEWTDFLKLLEAVCGSEKWGCVTLHGKLSKKKREENLDKFRKDPEIKILIATLGTGGQGLNLTEASKCVLTDPHWNDAAEEQAFSRVYRIGQKNETQMLNLILKGTIDMNIQSIKERKTEKIDTVKSVSKQLSTQEREELIREMRKEVEDFE